MRKSLAVIGILLSLVLIGTACETDGDVNGSAAVSDDAQVSNQSLDRFQETQPVPVFPWSQLRQNLIELNTAQAQTTITTTFFFNLGVEDPISQCQSIGFPIPSTAQLTNPDQAVWRSGSNGRAGVTVGLAEQTGVYTGDSTGTYVICTDTNGNAYADYWEGYVKTITGVAEWRDGQVVLVGEPTFDFSEGQ